MSNYYLHSQDHFGSDDHPFGNQVHQVIIFFIIIVFSCQDAFESHWSMYQ